MQVENDFLSNRIFLKEKNLNFSHYIELVQKNFSPKRLSTNKFVDNDEISLDFIQEFNGADEEHQCQLLANVKSMNKLWMYLLSNPSCYSCQMFLEELIQLASRLTSVKHHLGKS